MIQPCPCPLCRNGLVTSETSEARLQHMSIAYQHHVQEHQYIQTLLERGYLIHIPGDTEYQHIQMLMERGYLFNIPGKTMTHRKLEPSANIGGEGAAASKRCCDDEEEIFDDSSAYAPSAKRPRLPTMVHHLQAMTREQPPSPPHHC